jgi:proliferating cell nuclear antigen
MRTKRDKRKLSEYPVEIDSPTPSPNVDMLELLESSSANTKTSRRNVSSFISERKSNTIMNNFQDYIPDDNHILEMQTMAGNTFKNLLETLKSVLNDANIVFTEKGLKIAAVDSKEYALVHLFMEAEKFQLYHIKVKKLTLGIDVETLHRSIKTNKSNDQMCFIVKKDNPGTLEVSYENFAKGTRVTDKIKLLRLGEYQINHQIDYKSIFDIDSVNFQNICKEMAAFQATLLEIKSIGDKLIFRNLNGNNMREVEVRVGNGDEDEEESSSNYQKWKRNSVSSSESDQESAQGVFILKFLKSFAKAASLSPKVKIYLKNDSPLICEYSVSDLGTLRYVLTSEDVESIPE